MKNVLGRILLTFLIFVHVETFASTYEWSASINKKSAYVNEAIHLKYICSFSDASELYTIDFNPVGDYDKFIIKPLSQSEKIVEGKRVNSYEFIAFAKVAGRVSFDFEILMKQTTKESIENTVIGRDNVQKEEFVKKFLRQKTLEIDIKDAGSELVGAFAVEVKKEKPHVRAYEPYHMQITIKGSGNFEAIKPIEFKIESVKVFAGKITQNGELTQNGYTGEWSQKFAFVGSENFKIPDFNIEYFNLKLQKPENLTVDATDVNVTKAFVKEELLDDIEETAIKFNYNYLYYMLIFTAGVLVGKVKIKKSKNLKNTKELFNQKIDDAKSLQELMTLLVLRDSKKYEHIILEIEAKKLTSLKNAKKMSKLI